MGKEATARYREKMKREKPEEYRAYLDGQKDKSAQWRKDNPDKVAASNKKHRYYAYGLNDVALARLFASQDGRCAICQRALKFDGKWAVDHNHATGQVRGMLCYPCNVSLGQFQDSPAMLMRAIDYLEHSTFDVEKE